MAASLRYISKNKLRDWMIKQLLKSVIAKYSDLPVSRRWNICLSLRLQQIIDLLATDKSRNFAQPRPTIVNSFIVVLQGLKRQLNGNPLSCSERTTNWEPRSAAHIMFLDRQNVKCPTSFFLTRFRLQREGDYDSAKVRYSYTCCYLWVY